jgi:hypothetical protein
MSAFQRSRRTFAQAAPVRAGTRITAADHANHRPRLETGGHRPHP